MITRQLRPLPYFNTNRSSQKQVMAIVNTTELQMQIQNFPYRVLEICDLIDNCLTPFHLTIYRWYYSGRTFFHSPPVSATLQTFWKKDHMIPNHFKTTRDFQIFLPSLPSCEVSTSSIPWSQIQSAKNGVNKCLPLPLTSSSHRRLLNPLLVSASLSPNKDIMEHPQVNAGEWNYGLRNKSAYQRT